MVERKTLWRPWKKSVQSAFVHFLHDEDSSYKPIPNNCNRFKKRKCEGGGWNYENLHLALKSVKVPLCDINMKSMHVFTLTIAPVSHLA